MANDELAWMDACAQAELVRSGRVSPLELVDAAIERIERTNLPLNAVIFKRYEKARAEASNPKWIPDGPFKGVPFLMKDLVQMIEGEPFSWGWKPLKNAGAKAPVTSYVAQKFVDSGLITLGRTTVPEWGSNISAETAAWGVTRNPWDIGRSAGGSSSGAGASVASGMVPMAHGNDAGGSIRIPGSMCGLVGLKASRGRTSIGPLFADFWNAAIEEGVLARSVRDVATAIDAIQGYMPGDPWTAPAPARPYREEVGHEPGKLRIGFMDRSPASYPALDEECARAVRSAAKLLESLGHRVEASFPQAMDDPNFDKWLCTLVACHVAATLPYVERLLGTKFGPESFAAWTWALIQRGRQIPVEEYIAFGDWRNHFSRALAGWWSGGFDVLVTPTLATPAPLLGAFKLKDGETLEDNWARISRTIPFTPQWNFTGQPAITLPLHQTPNGLPVGVQFVAAYGREDLLFRLAAQIERAAPWVDRRPPVHG